MFIPVVPHGSSILRKNVTISFWAFLSSHFSFMQIESKCHNLFRILLILFLFPSSPRQQFLFALLYHIPCPLSDQIRYVNTRYAFIRCFWKPMRARMWIADLPMCTQQMTYESTERRQKMLSELIHTSNTLFLIPSIFFFAGPLVTSNNANSIDLNGNWKLPKHGENNKSCRSQRQKTHTISSFNVQFMAHILRFIPILHEKFNIYCTQLGCCKNEITNHNTVAIGME